MSNISAWFDGLRQQYPVAFALLVVPVVTIFGNWAIAYFKSAKWAEFQEKNVRLAGFMLLLKHLGINPVGIVRAIIQIITKQLPPDDSAPVGKVTDGQSGSGSASAEPRDGGTVNRMKAPWFPLTARLAVAFSVFGATLALFVPTPGCSALNGKTVEGAAGSACAVIDMAKEACMILRYADKDGHLVEVSVPAEDAKEFARAMGAKHGAKPATSAK